MKCTGDDGHEKSQSPNERQTDLGRFLVEFGVAEGRGDAQETLHRHERQQHQRNLLQKKMCSCKSGKGEIGKIGDSTNLCGRHGHDTDDGAAPRRGPLVRILMVDFAVDHVLDSDDDQIESHQHVGHCNPIAITSQSL